ncbi:hypothetical protein PJWF_00114 [Achromobacter phage JWF]|uniref:hypothetical protein n=1 Tax=Achromobacter phage JWF TaxID=1589748 RepID=UPI000588E141|nr:hypothetical protein AXJ13_gp074 [Achromobacter phage JWF]AJD83007.1 hypothetical protein PJWF_00114 [Achromobacter phage JWF]
METEVLHQWQSSCGQLKLDLTEDQMRLIARPGPNETAVAIVTSYKDVKLQLNRMDIAVMRQWLVSCGMDDVAVLEDFEVHRNVVWLAAWDIYDDIQRGS